MITKAEIINLISELVKIESVNSWLIPGGSGEKEVADLYPGVSG